MKEVRNINVKVIILRFEVVMDIGWIYYMGGNY